MATTENENMIVTKNIGLKAPKEDAFYEVGYIAENNAIIDKKFTEMGKIEDINPEIGASTMIEALNLTFQSGNEKRGILASNLVAMGVDADASEKWDTLLPKVKDISTGVDTSNDTVAAEVLLEGYTAHDANQEQIVGTLPDKTGTTEYTATATLDSTNSELQMTIPALGKYGTNNKLKATFAKIAGLIGLTAAKLVKGNTILGITGNSYNMDTSGGDATAAQILSGKKACVDGELRIGTMANKAGTSVAASAVAQDNTNTYFNVSAAGYYDTNSKVYTQNSNLKSNEITKIPAGQNMTAGSSINELCVLECVGKSTITFTPIGYGNYRNGIITLSIYGANTYNSGAVGNYNVGCTDRKLIKTINFNSGTEYTVDVSDYKYVSFAAKNNNDAHNSLDLTHVQLV